MSIKISETQTGGFTKTSKRSKEAEKGVSELADGAVSPKLQTALELVQENLWQNKALVLLVQLEEKRLNLLAALTQESAKADSAEARELRELANEVEAATTFFMQASEYHNYTLMNLLPILKAGIGAWRISEGRDYYYLLTTVPVGEIPLGCHQEALRKRLQIDTEKYRVFYPSGSHHGDDKKVFFAKIHMASGWYTYSDTVPTEVLFAEGFSVDALSFFHALRDAFESFGVDTEPFETLSWYEVSAKWNDRSSEASNYARGELQLPVRVYKGDYKTGDVKYCFDIYDDRQEGLSASESGNPDTQPEISTNENGFANHIGTYVALNDLAHEIFKDKTESAGLTNETTPSADTTEDINSPAPNTLP